MPSDLVTSNSQIFLQPDIINKLNSWEDFVGFYTQLEEVSSLSSWLKADLIKRLVEKFPDKNSLLEFSKSVNQKYSTIVNYLRIAKAFPMEKRIPEASFTLHFQASFIDSFDNEKQEFITDDRFKWLGIAIDQHWSTRALQSEIRRDKKTKALNSEVIPCDLCGSSEEETFEYIFYSPILHQVATHKDLHVTCFQSIIDKIGQEAPNGI